MRPTSTQVTYFVNSNLNDNLKYRIENLKMSPNMLFMFNLHLFVGLDI